VDEVSRIDSRRLVGFGAGKLGRRDGLLLANVRDAEGRSTEVCSLRPSGACTVVGRSSSPSIPSSWLEGLGGLRQTLLRYWPKPGERSCPLAFARLAGLFAPIRILPPGDLGQHGELLKNKALMKC
jgi:hypothetical protein